MSGGLSKVEGVERVRYLCLVDVAPRPARGSWPAGLTDREVEVLRLIASSCSAVEVANELHISAKTARNHIEHIYAKINTSNRTGAALFALTHGLVGVLTPG
jgi:DNA-binding CsgD family transcriptional regulator